MAFRLVVEIQQFGEGHVGIRHLDEGAGNGLLRLETQVDDGRRGFRLVDVVGIFRVGEEGQSAGDAFFNFANGEL